MLRHLDLFAGIGGFTRAAKLLGNIETTDLVEIDPDAQKVLKHHYSEIPLHSDIRSFCSQQFRWDLITSGWPCTDVSNGGLRQGLDGPSSGIWREAFRIALYSGARYWIAEQPGGLLARGIGSLLGAMRHCGYTRVTPFAISAAQFGFMHQRKRILLVAHSHRRCQNSDFQIQPPGTEWLREAIERAKSDPGWQEAYKRSLLPNNGLPVGVPRLPSKPNGCNIHYAVRRLMGKTVVPQQASVALQYALKLEAERLAAAKAEEKKYSIHQYVLGEAG